MLFLISITLAFLFAFLCGSKLKKHPGVFYLSALLISAAVSFIPSIDTRSLPDYINRYVLGLFTRGALATALWYVVMITGALPNGSVPMKKLMPIRGELSIFTAILTVGHNIGYGVTYFTRLFTDIGRMSMNQIAASICTILMLVIMLPLTGMSFPKIRRKMKPKLWKKIQTTAYIFYAMIFIHVMFLTIPLAKAGRDGYLFSVIVYSIFFIGYAVLRMRKSVLKNSDSKRKILLWSGMAASAALLAAVVLISVPNKKINSQENIHSVISVPAVTTASQKQTAPETKVSETVEVTDISQITQPVTSDKPVSLPESTSVSEVNPSVQEKEIISDDMTSEEQSPDEPGDNSGNISEDITEEPQYKYNNGQFSSSTYGYDGEVYITVTIENDVIVSITGYTDENDSWYYNMAAGQIIPLIIESQNTDADVFSGATYSSEAIIESVKKALELAER